MSETQTKKQKKSFFESPIMRPLVKSANAKIFPEGGLGYFIGPTLALIANSVLGSYLNAYMLNVLNMNSWVSWFVTWLPVVSVIFVVLGNILVGRLMDKNKTKAGKARPLLLIAIPLAILALLLLFVISPFANEDSNGTTQIISIICIAIGYNLWFALAYPFYYTSHASLVSLSTRNSKDRSLLATISNATSLAAIGLCSMIMPFFLNLLFKYDVAPDLIKFAGAAPVLDGSGVAHYTLNNAIIYSGTASYNAWKVFVIALIIATAIGIIVEFYFTRERVTEESFNNQAEGETVKKVPLKEQIKICVKDKYWWIMIAFFFLYQLGGMLKNTSQLYFCQAWFGKNGIYSIDIGGSFSGTIAIVGAIPTALGMVLAWPLANKIGKGRAIMCGAILAVIGGAIGFIDPSNFYLVVASFVIKALGSTPAMYLSLALLADTLDHQEAMHGIRTDGFTMTIYGAIMAGMTGIATGILNLVLNASGYTASNVSSPAIQTSLEWIFLGGETICYGVIAIVFIFMAVEKFSKFDFKAIVKDQRAKALAEGKEYTDPKTALAIQEEESNIQSEQTRIANLKAKCEKKGLNFEEEEAKYQKAQADKKAAAEAKKAAAEAKKAAKEAEKQAKHDAMSAEQRAAVERKEADKKAKQEKRDADRLAEFNKLRAAMNMPELTEEDLEEITVDLDAVKKIAQAEAMASEPVEPNAAATETVESETLTAESAEVSETTETPETVEPAETSEVAEEPEKEEEAATVDEAPDVKPEEPKAATPKKSTAKKSSSVKSKK